MTSRNLSSLHPFGQRPQITRRHLHFRVRPRCRIKDTLVLQVRLPLPARVAHGVASGVSEGSLLAGFDADSGHVAAKSTENAGLSQLPIGPRD